MLKKINIYVYFKASNGWNKKFKSKYGLVFKKLIEKDNLSECQICLKRFQKFLDLIVLIVLLDPQLSFKKTYKDLRQANLCFYSLSSLGESPFDLSFTGSDT